MRRFFACLTVCDIRFTDRYGLLRIFTDSTYDVFANSVFQNERNLPDDINNDAAPEV